MDSVSQASVPLQGTAARAAMITMNTRAGGAFAARLIDAAIVKSPGDNAIKPFAPDRQKTIVPQ